MTGKRTYYSKVDVEDEREKEMLSDVKEWFRYCRFCHYPTPEKYLENPTPIKINVVR
ncbi:Formylmethanofuran dehydrogenase subunit A [Methanosarcina barkeri str. Wiesmoor]|uniref:Formylmethanofuran dehydrogenase subunit A n=1 Tax=Methanosarcina barkeri str. Wiesmoor TaxID=1434109 RepID=A0A0E3LM15_METBA|nr:hypothetical protein [Methanosarcina barkeri]AKB52231.1 Formylmethanofuran dehydrogenase subunit A [Methanosarcina barkeri str. Wiesmoor]